MKFPEETTMIKILFIILIVYAIYKLVKGGYISITTPSNTAGAAAIGFMATVATKVIGFLKSVF